MIIKKHAGTALLSLLLWVWTGTLYFFMEVAWKTVNNRPGSISWTMLLLAIILAIPLERFGAELPWSMPIIPQALICACGITMVEFLAGLILNVWLNLGIWDYSDIPLNLMGQICIPFMGIWWILSIIGITMLDWMRYAIEGGERPHYTLLLNKKNGENL